VTTLRRYPVKSMLGEEVAASDVGYRGLARDRRLAVVSRRTGEVLSALLNESVTLTATPPPGAGAPPGTSWTSRRSTYSPPQRSTASPSSPIRLARLERYRPNVVIRTDAGGFPEKGCPWLPAQNHRELSAVRLGMACVRVGSRSAVWARQGGDGQKQVLELSTLPGVENVALAPSQGHQRPRRAARRRRRTIMIERMDHVGIVVDDLVAATEFFVELRLELQGDGPVEGRRTATGSATSAARRGSSRE
jgi:MOSC N-terminal beta barrel domain